MTTAPNRYQSRLLALIAFVVVVAALRVSYAVTMPLAFAALTVAAVWPLKRWFDRWLPAWISYILVILALIAVLSEFAVAVYFSLVQVISALTGHLSAIENLYQGLVPVGRAARHSDEPVA